MESGIAPEYADELPMNGPVNRRELLQASLALSGMACLPVMSWGAAGATLNERMSGDFAPVHDPCIIKADGVYHLFCTGHVGEKPGLIPWRTSKDLVHWQLNGRVFDEIPQWAQQAVPGARGIWAPDIAYFNGLYHLYYSCSTFGSNRSVIGLATNATLDPQSPQFAWQDRGLVVESQREDDFNAIDANHLQDRDGRHWLVLGSFWSGIKLFPLDPATGKPSPDNRQVWALASRPVPENAPGAIEAPFLIERDGYYYLFASFDYCCRGVNSTYYIVVGRSKPVTGPFVGRDGKPMTQGYGTLLLEGNRNFRGPGHNAFLHDGANDYLVYHAYDAQKDGQPTLRISPVAWTQDGWPTVAL
jgi:arabinan endo-1,5-alpha-L-arabinosidase